MRKSAGFTLLEILVALFIFTIVSMLLMGGLHTVMTAAQRVEVSAEEIANLQMAFLRLSRDIEVTLNRPITNEHGKVEWSLQGDTIHFDVTHAGVGMAADYEPVSTIERTRYAFHDGQLTRATYPVLDRIPKKEPQEEALLTGLKAVRFDYIDAKGQLQQKWPVPGKNPKQVPRGVKITVTYSMRGSVSQTYVIAAQ